MLSECSLFCSLLIYFFLTWTGDLSGCPVRVTWHARVASFSSCGVGASVPTRVLLHATNAQLDFWRPDQSLRLFIMLREPFLNAICSLVQPVSRLSAIRGCSWSAAVFGWLVYVQVTSTRRPGPEVSQQNINEYVMRGLFSFLHLSVVLMWWMIGVCNGKPRWM